VFFILAFMALVLHATVSFSGLLNFPALLSDSYPLYFIKYVSLLHFSDSLCYWHDVPYSTAARTDVLFIYWNPIILLPLILRVNINLISSRSRTEWTPLEVICHITQGKQGNGITIQFVLF